MINLYDSKCIDFSNNGLVVLSDCISCSIPEELNGLYELELEYPLDEQGKWQYLLEGNIIKADGQLFRIYHKVKTLNTIKCNARHIYYDLLDNFLEDVRPTNLSGASALSYILANTQYAHSFTSTGDVGGSNTKYFVRKNPIEAIMGDDGIINTWGGELVRDNFAISLLGARGLDRGILVAYGKNVQGIQETLDMDGLATRIMVLGKDALMLPEKYIDSLYIGNYSNPKIKVVEFTDIGVDVENGITEAMAIVLLRVAGQNYMDTSKCDIPQFNYKIDFLELSKTEEYKNYAVLERVYLGDTVTIKHSKLNIDLKAKVIKTTKNIITNRIEEIELGSFKPNIATSINNAIQEVKQDIVQVKSDYQKAIDNATNLITGTNGGNVVIRQDAEGKPYEILIMDTTDVMTAMKCWRFNLGGLGYSSTGINGPFETAITMDGGIVGKFITALSISASQIKTNELIVGNNIAMGANATISWAKVTSQPTLVTAYNQLSGLPYIPTLPSYITSTKITSTTIESPTIVGGLIQGARVQELNGTTMLADLNKNTYGGTLDIYDINGRLDVSMGAESGTGANIGGKMILYSEGSSYPKVELGVGKTYDAGIINLKDVSGVVRIAAYAGSNVGTGLFVLNSAGTVRSYLKETAGQIGGEYIATQAWVNTNVPTISDVNVALPNGCWLECLSGRLILHADATNYISVGTGVMTVVENGVGRPI